MKKTLKVGFAPREAIARHTRDVVAGRRRRTSDYPDPGETMKDFRRVWKTGKPERSPRISFASPKLLWKVLTAKRWELLKALCGVGPVSIREAARRVDRDVKAVHRDITALLNAGVLDRAPGGGVGISV